MQKMQDAYLQIFVWHDQGVAREGGSKRAIAKHFLIAQTRCQEFAMWGAAVSKGYPIGSVESVTLLAVFFI